MANERRGFHGLEQRIHEMEEEDARHEKHTAPERPKSEPARTEPKEKPGAKKE